MHISTFIQIFGINFLLVSAGDGTRKCGIRIGKVLSFLSFFFFYLSFSPLITYIVFSQWLCLDVHLWKSKSKQLSGSIW